MQTHVISCLQVHSALYDVERFLALLANKV